MKEAPQAPWAACFTILTGVFHPNQLPLQVLQPPTSAAVCHDSVKHGFWLVYEALFLMLQKLAWKNYQVKLSKYTDYISFILHSLLFKKSSFIGILMPVSVNLEGLSGEWELIY